MNKIKTIGLIVLILSIALAIISQYISNENNTNSNILKTINQQKAFTQEISKNIFYIYKNKGCSTIQLEESIKLFLKNMSKRDETLNEIPSLEIKKQSEKIVLLWNKFYLDVQKFRDQNKIHTAYTNIIIEKTVANIYSTNLTLIVEFNKLLEIHNNYFHNTLHYYKLIQYLLFILLLLSVVFFLFYIFRTTSNIDFLIKKINNTVKSIDQIENNVEDFLETIDENDTEVLKKEDAVIESLEELISAQIKLKHLQIELENLIKLKNKN